MGLNTLASILAIAMDILQNGSTWLLSNIWLVLFVVFLLGNLKALPGVWHVRTTSPQ